jgi:Ribosomal RNA-processing protein 7 (RRP7) C-terminal domain
VCMSAVARALHQGRHKTTDEEGTAVGGVAAAAAADIGARAKPEVIISAPCHAQHPDSRPFTAQGHCSWLRPGCYELKQTVNDELQAPANFYRFQQRERRRDELFALREQFEADKRKIQELKAMRRFRPM